MLGPLHLHDLGPCVGVQFGKQPVHHLDMCQEAEPRVSDGLYARGGVAVQPQSPDLYDGEFSLNIALRHCIAEYHFAQSPAQRLEQCSYYVPVMESTSVNPFPQARMK